MREQSKIGGNKPDRETLRERVGEGVQEIKLEKCSS